MIVDDRYRSQFETGTSNGGLTAGPGGARRRWEDDLFAGAYRDAEPFQRPTYGALNHRRRREGGSIRFGSAHLRLAHTVRPRLTFCYPDSTFEPENFGTAERMCLITLAESDSRDRLDDYIEAHLHGTLVLSRDVEAIVLDPSFASTPIETIARDSGLGVEWHQGFRLSPAELGRRPDYRGPEVVNFGRSVAEDGWLDARVVGAAVSAGADPQLAKRLWHCVARFGQPTASGTGEAPDRSPREENRW